jgi:hypothetical protein
MDGRPRRSATARPEHAGRAPLRDFDVAELQRSGIDPIDSAESATAVAAE